ncbi:MAG TPA: adenylate cyclase, partial [Pseudonocardiaceae bacterium]
DHVVLAVGHMDTDPAPREQALADFAATHELRYLPPAYTADLDLSAIEPGEGVLSRGFGLAFIDLMVLLTEGRGGRYERGPDGLRYLPSGAEPTLYVGSRRGVPYHAKPEYRLRAPPATFPKFFGPPEIERLPDSVDFRRDVWPLAAKEIGWGYYTELFTAHPDRVRLDFDEFAERYAEFDWDSDELPALVAKAVPAIEDRLDLNTLDRPLRGREFADSIELAEYLVGYVETDLARRRNPEFSADLGAFLALLAVFRQLAAVIATGRLDPRSQVSDVDGWWTGFFSYLASGPPGHRLDELLALHRAGIVRFVGPDMWVRAENGRFLAGSPNVPGTVSATTLIEARLPTAGVSRSPDPLLRALLGRGELTEEVLRDGTTTGRIVSSPDDAKLVDRAGREHPRRFALGPHTSRRAAAAFTRPRTNAIGFRENDAVAREILTFRP